LPKIDKSAKLEALESERLAELATASEHGFGLCLRLLAGSRGAGWPGVIADVDRGGYRFYARLIEFGDGNKYYTLEVTESSTGRRLVRVYWQVSPAGTRTLTATPDSVFRSRARWTQAADGITPKRYDATLAQQVDRLEDLLGKKKAAASTWKGRERAVAALVGGERRGPAFGKGKRGSGNNDIIKPGWSIEVKSGKSATGAPWGLAEAAYQQAAKAAKPGETPLAILCPFGSPVITAVVTVSDAGRLAARDALVLLQLSKIQDRVKEL